MPLFDQYHTTSAVELSLTCGDSSVDVVTSPREKKPKYKRISATVFIIILASAWAVILLNWLQRLRLSDALCRGEIMGATLHLHDVHTRSNTSTPSPWSIKSLSHERVLCDITNHNPCYLSAWARRVDDVSTAAGTYALIIQGTNIPKLAELGRILATFAENADELSRFLYYLDARRIGAARSVIFLKGSPLGSHLSHPLHSSNLRAILHELQSGSSTLTANFRGTLIDQKNILHDLNEWVARAQEFITLLKNLGREIEVHATVADITLCTSPLPFFARLREVISGLLVGTNQCSMGTVVLEKVWRFTERAMVTIQEVQEDVGNMHTNLLDHTDELLLLDQVVSLVIGK